MKHGITVILGEDLCRAVNDMCCTLDEIRLYNDEHQLGEIRTYAFDTEAEVQAYRQALNDCCGWYEVLEFTE